MIRDLLALVLLLGGVAALTTGGFALSEAAGWYTLGACLAVLGFLLTAGGESAPPDREELE